MEEKKREKKKKEEDVSTNANVPKTEEKQTPKSSTTTMAKKDPLEVIPVASACSSSGYGNHFPLYWYRRKSGGYDLDLDGKEK